MQLIDNVPPMSIYYLSKYKFFFKHYIESIVSNLKNEDTSSLSYHSSMPFDWLKIEGEADIYLEYDPDILVIMGREE